jgi:hypothetical protein
VSRPACDLCGFEHHGVRPFVLLILDRAGTVAGRSLPRLGDEAGHQRRDLLPVFLLDRLDAELTALLPPADARR